MDRGDRDASFQREDLRRNAQFPLVPLSIVSDRVGSLIKKGEISGAGILGLDLALCREAAEEVAAFPDVTTGPAHPDESSPPVEEV